MPVELANIPRLVVVFPKASYSILRPDCRACGIEPMTTERAQRTVLDIECPHYDYLPRCL